MKRKVGELFNRPIVQGNENVLSSNEILVEQKGNTFSLKERVNGEIKEVSGGGGSASGSAMEYYDISGLTGSMSAIVTFSSVAKFLFDGKPATGPSYYTHHITTATNFGGYLAAGFDMSMRIMQGDQSMTLKDMMSADLASLALPRITEAEFYTL